MTLEEAIALDIAGKIVEAAQAYEELVNTREASLEALLDLAVLYWVSTEVGFLAAHHLPKEFVDRADRRAYELLAEADRRFGPVPEVEFWRRWFPYRFLGEFPGADQCRAIAEQQNAGLIPYFGLYLQTGDPQYLTKVVALLAETLRNGTTKNRYIRSVLDSAIRTFGHQNLVGSISTEEKRSG